MGKLIVIEGSDGAGKTTQTPLLIKNLINAGIDVCEVSFPRYETPSGSLISRYLAGDFGSVGSDTAYGATALYAVDRFVSYMSDEWGRFYNNGGTVVATRYTTSNMLYQTAKIDRSLWGEYIDWLCDFEYNKIGIPKPDTTVFLDMPCDVAQGFMTKRYGGDDSKKDIHEKNVSFLERCREAALFAAEKCGWSVIPCSKDGAARSIEDINRDITDAVMKTLV